MTLTVTIVLAVAAVIVAIALWFLVRYQDREEDVPTAEPADVPSDEPKPEKPSDTEPMNGDPGVLTPAEEPKDDKPAPFFFEDCEWYRCIAPYKDFVVGQCYQCTEHGRLEGYLIKKPNDYFEPCEAPAAEEPIEPATIDDVFTSQEKEMFDTFDQLVAYFEKIVHFRDSQTTMQWLLVCLSRLYEQTTSDIINDRLYVQANFPEIIDVYGSLENPHVIGQMGAMLFYSVLVQVFPDKRNELAKAAFNYGVNGADQPIYGWAFNSDPYIARMMAFIWNEYFDTYDDLYEVMREETGGSMITYQKDISELWLDLTDFMPTAAPPYLPKYYNRRKGQPVEATNTADVDGQISGEVSVHYYIDTTDADFRQKTIQAISDKEAHLQHIFGKDRTVTDPEYGKMVFHPVFGRQTIGIEIPDDGAIAALAEAVGSACSNSRKPLLDQEYGRRRPGQGDKDPSANKNKSFRALVNYAIEEGDGHTTGYYNQDGDYVDGGGNHIGDYEKFYQGQLYANSYPSGHSAYIAGIALALINVMPDRADRIMQAAGWFRLSRVITRYHWMSDTTIGLLCGCLFYPVLKACTNVGLKEKVKAAREEYEKLKRQTP